MSDETTTCTCRVINGRGIRASRIEKCALCKAAGQMRDALDNVNRNIFSRLRSSEPLTVADYRHLGSEGSRIARAALAAAEGDATA